MNWILILWVGWTANHTQLRSVPGIISRDACEAAGRSMVKQLGEQGRGHLYPPPMATFVCVEGRP